MPSVGELLERESQTVDLERDHFERLMRRRDRKQRNRRIGALIVAAVLAIATIVGVTNALERRDTKVPVTPPSQNGRIAFGEQGPGDSNRLFTMNPDGTDVRDLSVKSRCISWAPDGSKILIAAHKFVGPATINPDGTGYTELDASTGRCGAFSPDGTRIVLGGSTELEPNHYYPRGDGIFTVRASDGGDLLHITPRNGTNPNYSPDGTQVVFLGVQGPRGACYPHAPPSSVGGSFTCPPGTYRIGELDGSVFVVNADGTGLHRIASQVPGLDSPRAGLPTDGGSCSRMGPGRSTSFTRTGPGFGASRWSRFRDCVKRTTRHGLPTVRASCSSDGRAPIELNLFTARKDGTDVEQITHTHGIVYGSTDWGTNAG